MKLDYIECGDCLELMKKIPSESVNMVLTSPPYNMTKRRGGYADSGRYDSYVDWLPEKDYIDWMINIFHSFDRILVKNGVILFNFSYSIENPSLPYKLIARLVSETSFDLADTIIWKKSNGIPFPANKRRLSRIWEFVFVIVRKNEMNSFNTNRRVKSTSQKTGQSYYDVAYNYIESRNNDGKCELNQATFSSDLVAQLIELYSPSTDDVILDPFMGTGTTPVGCIRSNRHYIGFEISEKQYIYAGNRINNVVAQQ